VTFSDEELCDGELLSSPSTPDGISRLRLTARAHHTDEELALAVEVLRRIVAQAPCR
jgi:7-keto-8-aminopelargonate synthetase-like enzyme